MGLTLTDKHGKSHTVTGEDYAQSKAQENEAEAGGESPPAQTKGEPVGYTVKEKVWGPPNENGTRFVLHKAGEVISEERAEELGLITKKAPEPENKKAPEPQNKKRSATSKKKE